MTACRPIQSFSKVAHQAGINDEDEEHSFVPSGRFWTMPHASESRTISHSPLLPVSSAVCCCFLSFFAVFRRPLLSPAILRHPRPPSHPLPSSTVPYRNRSQIVGLRIFSNDRRPGLLVIPHQALQGLRTAANTKPQSMMKSNASVLSRPRPP